MSSQRDNTQNKGVFQIMFDPKGFATQNGLRLEMLGKHSYDPILTGDQPVDVILIASEWKSVPTQSYKGKPVRTSGPDSYLNILGGPKKDLVVAPAFLVKEKKVGVFVAPIKADNSALVSQLSNAVAWINSPKVSVTKKSRSSFFVEPLGPASTEELADPAIVKFQQREKDGKLNLESVIPLVSNDELLNDPDIVYQLKQKGISIDPAAPAVAPVVSVVPVEASVANESALATFVSE
jgi:hypothetical protein